MEDENELKRLIRPEHREFIRQLHLDDQNDTSTTLAKQLESDEALLIEENGELREDLGKKEDKDSIIDYLDSLSPPETENKRAARDTGLTNGESSSSKITPIGKQIQVNDNSMAVAGI